MAVAKAETFKELSDEVRKDPARARRSTLEGRASTPP